MDIRGRVVKHREEGSDFFSTVYVGMRSEYLDAHIPGAVFVDWTKVGTIAEFFPVVKRLRRWGRCPRRMKAAWGEWSTSTIPVCLGDLRLERSTTWTGGVQLVRVSFRLLFHVLSQRRHGEGVLSWRPLGTSQRQGAPFSQPLRLTFEGMSRRHAERAATENAPRGNFCGMNGRK